MCLENNKGQKIITIPKLIHCIYASYLEEQTAVGVLISHS